MTPEQEQRLDELYMWMMERKQHQLSDPLDDRSKEILSRDFIQNLQNGLIHTPVGSGDYYSGYIRTRLENKDVTLTFNSTLRRCTVDPSANLITCNSHGLVNDDNVVFYTTGDYPGALDTTSTKYVISATANTFQVSTSSGGAAIDITSAGEGDQYFSLL